MNTQLKFHKKSKIHYEIEQRLLNTETATAMFTKLFKQMCFGKRKLKTAVEPKLCAELLESHTSAGSSRQPWKFIVWKVICMQNHSSRVSLLHERNRISVVMWKWKWIYLMLLFVHIHHIVFGNRQNRLWSRYKCYKSEILF